MQQPTSGTFGRQWFGYSRSEVDAHLAAIALERHAWETKIASIERERSAADEAAARHEDERSAWEYERSELLRAITEGARAAEEERSSARIQTLFEQAAAAIAQNEDVAQAQVAAMVADGEHVLAAAQLRATALIDEAERRAEELLEVHAAQLRPAIEEFHRARTTAATLLEEVVRVVHYGTSALSSLGDLDVPAATTTHEAELDAPAPPDARADQPLAVGLAG